MEFKKFAAGPISYGISNPPKKEYPKDLTNVNFHDNKFEEHYGNRNHPNYSYIRKFIEIMGICHTLVVEKK